MGLQSWDRRAEGQATPSFFSSLLDKRRAAPPFLLSESGNGQECATLVLDVARNAPKGVFHLEVDEDRTSLVSYDSKQSATTRGGGLRAKNGTIRIQ